MSELVTHIFLAEVLVTVTITAQVQPKENKIQSHFIKKKKKIKKKEKHDACYIILVVRSYFSAEEKFGSYLVCTPWRSGSDSEQCCNSYIAGLKPFSLARRDSSVLSIIIHRRWKEFVPFNRPSAGFNPHWLYCLVFALLSHTVTSGFAVFNI